MIKSNGPLKSIAEIKRVGRSIQELAQCERDLDAAAWCLDRPHAVLARPVLQEMLVNEQRRLEASYDAHNCPDCGLNHYDCICPLEA